MSRPVVTLAAGVDQDHRHVMILDLDSFGLIDCVYDARRLDLLPTGHASP
jgi:hypothetical protein